MGRARKARVARKELKDLKESRGHKARRVHREHKAQWAHKDLRVHKDCKALPVRQLVCSRAPSLSRPRAGGVDPTLAASLNALALLERMDNRTQAQLIVMLIGEVNALKAQVAALSSTVTGDHSVVINIDPRCNSQNSQGNQGHAAPSAQCVLLISFSRSCVLIVASFRADCCALSRRL